MLSIPKAESSRAVALGDRYTWEPITDRVSFIRQTLKRPGKNGRLDKIKAVYVGCTYDKASVLRNYLVNRMGYHPERVTIRPASRSIDWDYEIKVQGDFSSTQVWAIADISEARLNFFTRQPEWENCKLR